ncbi:hypothetical protein [Metabacillus fastidiosus]|uniref:Uncharacterized protein n=1 Tax=Metabacillus fastidiosus TaxID=1458 RepID=A0ABU6NS89_9BACI|nr:hypothetical protein [Metabacillus fastidiosus]
MTRIKDHLTREQQKQINHIVKPNEKVSKAKKEEPIDWNDIMGVNKRGLRRKKGGAWTN